MLTRFRDLRSQDAGSQALWAWARDLVRGLNKFKLFNLSDVTLTGKAYSVVRVNSAGNDYELGPEIMESLRGVSLVGKAGKAVVVNATEDGFTIAP